MQAVTRSGARPPRSVRASLLLQQPDDGQAPPITGDGPADNFVVNATNGVDTIFVEGDADSLKVIGLAAAFKSSARSSQTTDWTSTPWQPTTTVLMKVRD
jgi:hypothetical protein